MVNHYSILLFDARTFNPFFTVLGLLIGAAGIGIGYGAIKLLSSSRKGKDAGNRAVGAIVGLILLGGAVFVLGLAALCAMWVAG
jgi:hypothetical protein